MAEAIPISTYELRKASSFPGVLLAHINISASREYFYNAHFTASIVHKFMVKANQKTCPHLLPVLHLRPMSCLTIRVGEKALFENRSRRLKTNSKDKVQVPRAPEPSIRHILAQALSEMSQASEVDENPLICSSPSVCLCSPSRLFLFLPLFA